MTPTSSSCDVTVLSPAESPYLARNLAAHRVRWGIDLPGTVSGAVSVTGVPATRTDGDEAPAWPVGVLLCARVATADGSALKVHSDRQPVDEAALWLRQALPEPVTPPVVAIIGAGLGYAIEVLERTTDTAMLVLEPEPQLVPWLLARRDWTPLIGAGRLLVLPGPDYAAAPQAWGLFGHAHRTAPPVLVHPVIGRARPDAAAAAGSAIARALHGARANALARRRFEAPYLLNTLANVGARATAPGIASVRGAAAGRPVVIAGAGPSLNDNIEQLRPHRSTVVLIATDTALTPLLAADLPPDYVVAVDPGVLNVRHLAGALVPPQTVLVAECSVDPAALAPFGSRVVLFRVADHAPWRWLTGVGYDPGTLRAWGSVITSAFDLALHLDGSPIILIGADLAYTGGQPYCRGTRYEDDWAAAAEALDQPLDVVWASAIASQAVTDTDLLGATIRTAPHLIAYRDWLVRASEQVVGDDRRAIRRRIVNATGAGILRGGAIEQAPVADLLTDLSRVHPPFVVPAPLPRHFDPPARNRADAHLWSHLMHRDGPASSFTPPNGGSTPYMARSRKERARDTRQLRVARGTDTARWQVDDNLDVAWERRAVAAAALVPPGSRVLDLGAGREALARHLPGDATYVPADVVRRSDRTVVADVNAGQFPPGRYDVVTTLGLLEYVHDLPALLRRTAEAAPMLVASYCVLTQGTRDPRLQRGWMNDLVLAELLDLFAAAGWMVAWAERLDELDDFDQWLFACRTTTGLLTP